MVNWDDIEKTITEHRDAFEIDAPGSRSEALFFQRIDALHRKQVVRKRWQIVGYAASLAAFVLLSVSILWVRFSLNQKHETPFAYNQPAAEFNEARNYLMSEIDNGIEQIKRLPFREPQQIDSIMSEFAAMDENNKQLFSELSSNPDDERITDAIINVYMVKMDAINQILRTFSMSQNNKIQHDENNI